MADHVRTNVVVEQGEVRVVFAAPVTSLELTPEDAREMARRLIVRAEEAEAQKR